MGNVPSPRYRRTLQQCQRVEGQSFYSLILPANIEHGVHLYWVVRGTSSSKNVVPTCNREMIDTSAKNYNSVRHCFKEGCTFKTQWNLRESGKSLPEIQIALNQNLKDMDKLAVYTCQKGLSKQGTIVQHNKGQTCQRSKPGDSGRRMSQLSWDMEKEGVELCKRRLYPACQTSAQVKLFTLSLRRLKTRVAPDCPSHVAGWRQN